VFWNTLSQNPLNSHSTESTMRPYGYTYDSHLIFIIPHIFSSLRSASQKTMMLMKKWDFSYLDWSGSPPDYLIQRKQRFLCSLKFKVFVSIWKIWKVQSTSHLVYFIISAGSNTLINNLTWPQEIFLPQIEKIVKFDVFRGNFPNSNPNHKWLTRPGSKNFYPDPSLLLTKSWID